MLKGSITDVPGIRVGHAAEDGGRSGCTVLLGPFRGAVEVTGLATGSRELGVLRPHHVAPQVQALLLTGGSAFGLAAADGVMKWLAENRMGFEVGSHLVPLVPTAVIFDLQEGVPTPDANMGFAACENATDAIVDQGRVGAGAGATIGKVGGPERAVPGGLGSYSIEIGPWRVGALAVVNAFGDVLDEWGSILAGAQGDDGVFLNTSRVFRETMNRLAPSPSDNRPAGTSSGEPSGSESSGSGSSGGGSAGSGPAGADSSGSGSAGSGSSESGTPGEATPARDSFDSDLPDLKITAAGAVAGGNTTLTVVATDAPLSRVDLERVARVAANGVARRIAPVNTPFDGDITFVLSTAPEAAPLPDFVVTGLGTTAADAIEVAIERAVTAGRTE